MDTTWRISLDAHVPEVRRDYDVSKRTRGSEVSQSVSQTVVIPGYREE
jgi:hypothetical protein